MEGGVQATHWQSTKPALMFGLRLNTNASDDDDCPIFDFAQGAIGPHGCHAVSGMQPSYVADMQPRCQPAFGYDSLSHDGLSFNEEPRRVDFLRVDASSGRRGAAEIEEEWDEEDEEDEGEMLDVDAYLQGGRRLTREPSFSIEDAALYGLPEEVATPRPAPARFAANDTEAAALRLAVMEAEVNIVMETNRLVSAIKCQLTSPCASAAPPVSPSAIAVSPSATATATTPSPPRSSWDFRSLSSPASTPSSSTHSALSPWRRKGPQVSPTSWAVPEDQAVSAAPCSIARSLTSESLPRPHSAHITRSRTTSCVRLPEEGPVPSEGPRTISRSLTFGASRSHLPAPSADIPHCHTSPFDRPTSAVFLPASEAVSADCAAVRSSSNVIASSILERTGSQTRLPTRPSISNGPSPIKRMLGALSRQMSLPSGHRLGGRNKYRGGVVHKEEEFLSELEALKG